MVRLLIVLFLLTHPPLSLALSECGGAATPIAVIQGPGGQSAMVGQEVAVEGILTRDARTGTGLDGFYLQQADRETDGDPTTSEALFIYTRKTGGQVGDRLRVQGIVKEYHGLTELHSIQQVIDCGQGKLPEPIGLSLPLPNASLPEALENMRVRITGPLTVIDQYHLFRYGQVTLASEDQWIPTQQDRPGPASRQLLAEQARDRLILDDGRSVTRPDRITWLADAQPPRTGDRIGPATGILDYRFKAWRFHPDGAVPLERTNPRPEAPPRPTGASLRIMAFNLQNYFNGNGQGGGFDNSRGARSQADLQRQTRKLAAALTAPDPDIIAVMELEADGFGEYSSVAQLIRAMGRNWQFVRADAHGDRRAIRNGLLYRSDRVVARGKPQVLDLEKHQGRPVIAQSFRPTGKQQQVRIAVTHLKSKSCRNAEGLNSDQGDGQGCWTKARTRAAQRIAAWLNSLPATEAHRGTLLTGDLNSYAMEDPLVVLGEAGFTNLAVAGAYSFRFRGRRGTLDYALANPRLAPAVLNSVYWRINSDEAPGLGYDGPQKRRHPGLWRASDHDPVITDLHL